MTKDLLKLRKELKSFAKRVKNFKYTETMLITFLMTGLVSIEQNLFSKQIINNSINNQTKKIDNSIKEIQQNIKAAKYENDKLSRKENLELIQLMEQGEYVVKSPWSNWQYAINSYYNDWHTNYNGKGNRGTDYNTIYRNRDQSLYRFLAKSINEGTSNASTLSYTYEPNAAIPLNASVTPKSITKNNPNIVKNITIARLPSFEPRIVNDPTPPNISEPQIDTPTAINLSAVSLGNGGGGSILGSTNIDGVIQAVGVTSGDLKVSRTRGSKFGNTSNYTGNWDYTLQAGTKFEGVNIGPYDIEFMGNTYLRNGSVWSYTPPANGLSGTADTRTGFFQIAHHMSINNTNILYTNNQTEATNHVGELVHQDLHNLYSVDTGRTKIELVTSKFSGGSNVNKAYKNTVAYTNDMTIYKGTVYGSGGTITTDGQHGVLPFINSGNITMEGKKLAFSNSYDHYYFLSSSPQEGAALIINTGNISSNPYQRSANNYEDTQNAIFVMSTDVTNAGNQQTYYNSGKVNTWTKETALFLLTSRKPRPVNIVNTDGGEMNMYGEKSSGIYIKDPANVHLNFTNATATGTTTTTNGVTHTDLTGSTNIFNSMVLYGDKSTGLYVTKEAKTSTVTGYFGLDIGDATGTSNKNFSNTTATTQGILITDYNINPTMGTVAGTYHNEITTKHATNPFIQKTTKNTDIQASAGIYSFGKIELQGHRIRIYDNTDGNVGVYSADSNVVYNLGAGTMLLEKGKNNTAIAVGQNKGKVMSESEITLNGGIGNVAIYAATAGSKRTSTTPTETVTAKNITSTNTVNSIGIFADKGAYVELSDGFTMTGATISNNPIVKTKDANNVEFGGENAGAVYATNGSTVVINRSTTPTSENIDITGKEIVQISSLDGTTKNTGNYVGFGLFADAGSKINAKNNSVKVIDGATGVASIKGSHVDLENGKLIYSGEGYALYTGNPDIAGNAGTINFKNGTLNLEGKSIGFVRDITDTIQWVDLTNATINVLSDDVIVTSLKDGSGTGTVLNATNSTPSLKDQIFGTKMTVNVASGITKYKYALVDGATMNIKGDIDKADTTTDTDSEVFTRRLQIQNSLINVYSSNEVKAHLDATELSLINPNLTVPVGLDVSASVNSKNRTTTGITVANGATITADKTDGTSNGGVGVYVNYGTVKNDGNIEVEKGTVNDANTDGVGIYATNGTEVLNDSKGIIDVSGKTAIGILGLSYRVNNNGNPVYEKFGTTGMTQTTTIADNIGLVDITNKGKIKLDGENTLGIYVKNNSLDAIDDNNIYLRNNSNYATAINAGEITMSGKNAVGMIAGGGTITNDTKGKIIISNQESVAMYGTSETGDALTSLTSNKLSSKLVNKGTIELANTTKTTPIIGMFTDDADTTISTSGTINVGKKSYGIYGASNDVTMSDGVINVGEDGVGIFATGSSDSQATTPTSTVTLSGGTINVGNKQAVGVFIADDTTNKIKTTVNNSGTNSIIGNDSFGYVVDSTTGSVLNLGANSIGKVTKLTASVGTDSVYVYSNDKTGAVFSYTDITTTGSKSYGLYTAGEAVNYGTLTLNSGNGNVGIYSTTTSPTGKGSQNYGIINVGKTDTVAKEFGIGMATGYYDETTKAISNEGLIENYGTINVTEKNSIGMYAVGSNAKAINHKNAIIDISGGSATGMYLDHGAEGINYGTIKSSGSARGIKGVATLNGAYIKNYGTILITSPNGIGIYQDEESTIANKSITGNVSGTKRDVYSAASTEEKFVISPKGSLLVRNPPAVPTVTINGREVQLTGIDTNVANPAASYIMSNGVAIADLSSPQFSNLSSNARATEIGMYVDTSGIHYTNPIQGLDNLVGLDEINLIIGTEAAKYTDAKAIQIGENILEPYNTAMIPLTTTGTILNINSAGFTWLAQPVKGTLKPIDTLYMVKIPYTLFTSPKDENTYNFLDGLEKRYGVDVLGSRERLIFDKINDIGKAEGHIFTQAVDEMKGHQYSNLQYRINATGNILDKEFNHLQKDWRNPSKQNNKIKVFGIRDEYNTNTAGIIDYTSNAYGVVYVHEDEAIKLGNSIGWYAGAITNRFKFKDIGHSKENQTMIKAGILKTISPSSDHNGALRWTIAGDVFAGINDMKRKYLVVDDIFEAKSDYHSYGAAVKNELGYDIRMSPKTHLRPFGTIKMEYGRFESIEEESGQMKLAVKGNDYISVKPEVGVEFRYVQPLAVRTNLSVGLSASYENEIGKLQKGNQARVRKTTANWYNLEKEKENRGGNGKFDLKVGVDNTRFGVTANFGYETKGKNVKGGIGLRAIF